MPFGILEGTRVRLPETSVSESCLRSLMFEVEFETLVAGWHIERAFRLFRPVKQGNRDTLGPDPDLYIFVRMRCFLGMRAHV
jgi:hypothetical protein